MTTATVQEVQASLASLISGLKPGEELVITEQGQTIARLVAEPTPSVKSRQPGSAIGKLRIIEEDEGILR